MYICVCNGVNEDTVRQAARKSPDDVTAVELYASLGVKPQCGMCLCDTAALCQKEQRAN